MISQFICRLLPAWLRRMLRCYRSADFRALFEFVDKAKDPDNWRYYMTASLQIATDDNGTHTAVLNCLNLDGSAATDVTITYSSDNTAVALVDATSGVLTRVSSTAGDTCNITGSGVRGSFSHSDVGTVTVVAAVGADFTASLTLA